MKISTKLAGALHRHTRSPIRRLWLVAAGVWLVGASLLVAMLGFGLLAAPGSDAVIGGSGGESFLVCPDGHSGIATTVTSCSFAENVRYAYLTQGGPVVVAYSPVTGMAYTMQCQPGFTAQLDNGMTVFSVRCVGGNNAVVVLF